MSHPLGRQPIEVITPPGSPFWSTAVATLAGLALVFAAVAVLMSLGGA